MAKFTVELELDWLEEGQTLDDALKEEILQSVESRVTGRVVQELTKKLTEKLNKVVNEKAGEVVDIFIEKTLKDGIKTLRIPRKKSSWSDEVDMVPISEFVGMQYEEFLNKKVFDKQGNQPMYDRGKVLSINEYFIKGYLEKELVKKVSDLIQKARKDAEETVVSTIEYQLREQLSADIISRLNIPKMLSSLQEKVALLGDEETKNNG